MKFIIYFEDFIEEIESCNFSFIKIIVYFFDYCRNFENMKNCLRII